MASTTFIDYDTSTPIVASWLNEVDAVVWDIFGGATTVADANTALGTDDLSCVTNVVTARTNLDVYSKSETYTQTEVDGIDVANSATDQAYADALVDDLSGVSDPTTARTNLGLGTTDSPQFTTIEVGHASDSTLARASAGDLSVEGNIIYRSGGTDVPLTDGGTGASTASDARTNLDVYSKAEVDANKVPIAIGDYTRTMTVEATVLWGKIASWSHTGNYSQKNLLFRIASRYIVDDVYVSSQIGSGGTTSLLNVSALSRRNGDYSHAYKVIETSTGNYELWVKPGTNYYLNFYSALIHHDNYSATGAVTMYSDVTQTGEPTGAVTNYTAKPLSLMEDGNIRLTSAVTPATDQDLTTREQTGFAKGIVTSAGVLTDGTGCTTSRIGVGHYRVTFSAAQADTNYIILATADSGAGTVNVTWNTKTTTTVEIYTSTASSGAAVDAQFNFEIKRAS